MARHGRTLESAGRPGWSGTLDVRRVIGPAPASLAWLGAAAWLVPRRLRRAGRED